MSSGHLKSTYRHKPTAETYCAITVAQAAPAMYKDNRDFLDLKSYLIGGVLHLYLEGVALEADVVEVDRLQHATTIAHKAGGGVADGNTGDNFRNSPFLGLLFSSAEPLNHFYQTDKQFLYLA